MLGRDKYGQGMVMDKNKIDLAICSALKRAITDERSSHREYKEIIRLLYETYLTESMSSEEHTRLARKIRDIIADEREHELTFMDIAGRVNCSISQIKPKRKEYYELPKEERVRLAKEAVSRMYSY